jgi:hypothetical protein
MGFRNVFPKFYKFQYDNRPESVFNEVIRIKVIRSYYVGIDACPSSVREQCYVWVCLVENKAVADRR